MAGLYLRTSTTMQLETILLKDAGTIIFGLKCSAVERVNKNYLFRWNRGLSDTLKLVFHHAGPTNSSFKQITITHRRRDC